MMLEPFDKYLTPDEVADRLKVCRRTVYRWIDEGLLHASKLNRIIRISYDSFLAFSQKKQ